MLAIFPAAMRGDEVSRGHLYLYSCKACLALPTTSRLGRLSIYADWLHALRAQRDLLDRYRTAPHAQRPALYRLIRGNDQRLASELLARSIDEAERELQLACAPQRDLFGRSMQVDPERCRELHQRITEQKKMLEARGGGEARLFSRSSVHFAHGTAWHCSLSARRLDVVWPAILRGCATAASTPA